MRRINKLTVTKSNEGPHFRVCFYTYTLLCMFARVCYRVQLVKAHARTIHLYGPTHYTEQIKRATPTRRNTRTHYVAIVLTPGGSLKHSLDRLPLSPDCCSCTSPRFISSTSLSLSLARENLISTVASLCEHSYPFSLRSPTLYS